LLADWATGLTLSRLLVSSAMPQLRSALTPLLGIRVLTVLFIFNCARRARLSVLSFMAQFQLNVRVPSENTEQRRLAPIMFTDMVGYGALAQGNEALALQLLEEHRGLLRALFPRFNGREVKTIGDGFLVEFNSALEAAQCAIEIQRTLSKRNHDVPAERRIELRIGVHIGDVVHRGGDVYGDGVNIASRIEQLAGAGGICVSMDVERQIRNALEARFEKLAPTELKNISVPMDLFRIVLPWEPSVRRGEEEAQASKSTIERRKPKLGWIPIAAILLLSIIGIGWWWTTH